jgi:hypothetical protein
MPNWLPNVERDSNAGKIVSELSVIGPFTNFSCFPEEEVNFFFFYLQLKMVFHFYQIKMSIACQYFVDNELTPEQFKIIAQGIRPMLNSLRVGCCFLFFLFGFY